MTDERTSGRIPWNLVVGFTLFVIAVVVIGQLYYARQKEHIRQEKQDDLLAIADTKVAQISQWRQERLADARSLREAPLVRENVRALTEHRALPLVAAEFKRWLEAVRSNGPYESVWLLDDKGNNVLPGMRKVSFCGEDVALVRKVSQQNEVVLSDLHKDSTDGRVTIALAVPIVAGGKANSSRGVLILLRMVAQANLFPIVNSLPNASKTSEVLLVERVGDDILFLNEVKGRTDTALARYRVIDRAQTPSGLAVTGKEGIVETIDYRGVPVLAALKAIPDSPWHIVVKTSVDELYAPIRERWLIVMALMIVTIFGAASWIALVWRNQRSKEARRILELELKRKVIEEHFDALMRYANDGIVIIGLDGEIIDANEKALSMYGSRRDEFIGRNVRDTVSTDQQSLVPDRMAQVQERNGLVFESVHRRTDGSEFPVEVSSRVISAEGKQFFQNIIRDITERKRAERYLLENEERTRVALSGANIAVFSQTADLRYTWMYNPQPGYNPTDIAGKTDRDLFPPEEAEQIMAIKRQVVLQGKGIRTELSVDQNGRRSHYELTVEPLKNNRGEVIGITGASLDITERKRSEVQLQIQKAYFQQLFESAPEAIILMKQDESILEVNREFTRLFGFTQEEVVGRRINDLIVPSTLKDEGLQLTNRVAKGQRINAESVRMRKDGSIVDVSILGCPVRVDGGAVAIYGIYRDISDRKRAEASIRNSESSFRGLFNSVNDAIYVQDKQGRFLDVNDGAARMYGYPREFFLGKSPVDLSAPGMNDLAHVERLVQKAFEGEAQQFEFWGRRSNGEVFPKDVRVSKGAYFGQEVVVALAQDITERNKFEAALQETNETLESLIKASPLAITVLDPEGNVQLWNPAAEGMFGWKSDEVLGKFNPIVQPGKRGEFLRLHARALADEPANEMEVQRQRKDGSTIEISRSTAVLRDSVGNVKGVVAVLADITERKRSLERLRESEERLRLALTAASMMSWELDLTKGLVRWSESGHEFYGMKPEEFSGTREAYIQIIHPEDRAMAEELMSEAIRSGKDYKAEFRIVWPDGSVHWHGAYGRVLRDQSGRPVLMYGIGVDITERKKAEEAIQRLHLAVEQTDEVIIMTDQAGVITYVNPAFEKLYRYSREEAIGRTPRILKSGAMSREYYMLFWRDLLAGKSIRAEHINKSKDGRIVIVEASVNPVYDAKGKLSGFIAVQEDISERKRNEQERKRLESQLMQTQKLESIGTLAGGIAHDFNNILGIILAYSSMLRDPRSSAERSSNAIDVINQAVERGASLVRQILTFARKTDVIYGLVNVNIMVKELKKMLSETFPRTISIEAELGSDIAEITADATQLHQAILNICVNARDAMPAGGKLVLRTESGIRSEVQSYFPEATGERYVHISIADTGAGMDEMTRQRIFEPFFTTKPKGKGTGLGLSVVYGVVKNHTGFVRVDSEVGKGTAFHLYFPCPVRKAETGETVQRPLIDVPGGTECVLLVEDETALLDVLEGMLKSKGYRVLVARDGYEAVETYRDHKKEIAVVVSDLGLPKMTGQDAFMRMKSINPRVKVIFGTGYLDPDLKTELLNLGARGFLSKPYSQEELLRRIRELIDWEG